VTGQEGLIDEYLQAIERQIPQINLHSRQIESIVIGGGTPLLLSAAQLERLFRMLPGIDSAPICIETSPNETSPEKIAVLKSFNVQRVSLGVQSFVDSELKALIRHHSADSAHKALELLRDFPILNVDLIYGIPGQTINTLLDSLMAAMVYEPEEVFLYPLYIRKGTGLEGCIPQSTFDDVVKNAQAYLHEQGYTALSMRRYAKSQGFASSCGFEKTIALGCGGRSYLGNLHFCSPYSVYESECLKAIEAFISTENHLHITHGIFLNDDELKRRYIIKNLLHSVGLSLAGYKKAFGTNAIDEFPILNQIKLQRSGDTIHLEHGFRASDEIGPLFISPDIARRMRL